MVVIRNKNLVLPELSYLVVGALFEVSDALGFGYHEKHYYNAIKSALIKRGLKVSEQMRVPISFQSSKIGDFYLDFLINDKIVLEIKAGVRFRKIDFDQVKIYLKATGCPLGILARIDKNGVTFHRILAPKQCS